MNILQTLSIWVLPVLFAVTLHEVAHGLTARYFGDLTAEQAGRLSLNPLRHIDPIGTVLVPAVLLVVGGFVFGWARPVPVDPRRMRNPKRDMAVVAAAGPLSNLVMALGWAVVARIGLALLGEWEWAAKPMIYMGQAGIVINLILMLLNLLPLPPLDGGRVVAGVLPNELARRYSLIEPYGLFILLGLLFLGILGKLLSGPFEVLRTAIFQLFNLPF